MTGMLAASRRGDLSLIKFFVEKGANDWDRGMYRATFGGHKKVVEFFLNKGADLHIARYFSHCAGHQDIVKLLDSKQA